MSEPAYRRLPTDERRAQLLEQAQDLFGRYGYDELSMARIANEAKISKALLYHYFPSKVELFRAALAQGALELQERTAVDDSKNGAEQLGEALGAFLAWIEERPQAYVKLMESAGAGEVREIVADVRTVTAQRILDGLGDAGQRPATRAAVSGWLWFLDGAILNWIQHDDLPREELHGMLLGTLMGALVASGADLSALMA